MKNKRAGRIILTGLSAILCAVLLCTALCEGGSNILKNTEQTGYTTAVPTA